MTGRFAIEVSRLVKAAGPLTKRLHLSAGGVLSNDSSDCRMTRGRIQRLSLDRWQDLAPLLEQTPRNVAWALGALDSRYPDEAHLVPKGDPQVNKPGFVARVAENFTYRPGAPALVLLDHDDKGMPAAVKARIDGLGGFAGAVTAACSALGAAGYIRRRSTSADVSNATTGELYASSGEHVFILVADGADARRFLSALHLRAWLCGLGWHLVGKAGQLLDRSIIDRMVYAPERLVFEAAPDLEPPLEQGFRQATVHEGAPLDTLAACPDLSARERFELQRLVSASAIALKPNGAAARVSFVADKVAKAVERGDNPERARATGEAWAKGILRPGVILEFDDKDIGTKTVADVLADPARFDGEVLADPIEGVSYGRTTAMILAGGRIFSFAHGRTFYRLVHDAVSLEAAIAGAAKEMAAKILARLITGADVTRDERKALAKLAGERSGAGSRVVEKMVAEALNEQKAEEANERRVENQAASTKPRLRVPLPDAEADPVMEVWDDILGSAEAPEPPMRDVEGCPVRVQQRQIAGLHELTQAGGNDDEDEKTRLPAPKVFVLTKHDAYSLEIELSHHMTFTTETKQGERAVGAPFRLLNHWIKFTGSKLPTVCAVVTMPLVLPSGELMSGNGLDKTLGVVFRIEPDLLKCVPTREACTPIAVAKAYRFLTDEWLVDVAADREGKAVLIAFALSIIERILFPERPAFYVTAGLRGNGKTTAISIIHLAVLGVKASATAWTNESEERRKTIFSVLRDGAPSLIFDNIPRGAAISCSHIERALTAETYQDRVLGESRTLSAPAFTIIGFTGINIRPKGDTASRSLTARLSANQTDPENRKFVHDDPVAWTLDHRGEILGALYTVLLGNPRPSGAPQTRFKPWWLLVGSAIENAIMEATGAVLSFKDLFGRVEADDDDAVSRSDILKTLNETWPERTFTTADIFECLRAAAEAAKASERPETPEMVELRRFCTAPKANAPSPKAITRALKAIEGAPTAIEGAILTLSVDRDSNTKATIFQISVKDSNG